MTDSDLQPVIDFYRRALTVNSEERPTAVLTRVLAEDFVSRNAQENKSAQMLAGQLEAFWGLIPDMRWEPQDILSIGEKVVVRSIATGSPNGNFMGTPLDGSRGFRIDTIDIHTLREGRIAEVYHLEDWATAMRQLAG